MSGLRVRTLAAAGLLLAGACARVAPAPEGTVLGSLYQAAGVRETLRGQATVTLAGAGRSTSFPQVILVALPDRARLEVQSMVGSTALLLTIAGDQLRYRSFLQHEYVAAPATRETLDRLAGIPVPPRPLLRLLLGLAPLPLQRADPRTVMEAEGQGFRVETVDGALSQRLWTGAGGLLERGELSQAGQRLLTFALGDYRLVDGLPFPFHVSVQEADGARRLAVRYDSVKLNDAIPADLFDLPRPTDGRTRVRDLTGS
jgi:hypothetical protein